MACEVFYSHNLNPIEDAWVELERKAITLVIHMEKRYPGRNQGIKKILAQTLPLV